MKRNTMLIISLFICITECTITIIGPDDLSSQFDNRRIEMAYDKIGRSSYNFYTRGELYLDEEKTNWEACRSVKNLKTELNQYQEDSKILIVKRGGCSFVQKARNVQRAGYSMIVIVNNMETEIKDVIMSDDGSGSDIYIPIVMISKTDGEKIINYLEKNNSDKNKVIVEIDFDKKRRDTQTVDVKFFFSSSELRAYELFKSLTQYISQFGNQINFEPIYVVHRSPYYNEENPIRTLNCVSRGKYCYFPKETTIIKDGQAIIMEDLRQKCIYESSKRNDNLMNYYTYMKYFHSQCLVKDRTPQFNENCAKKVLHSMAYTVNIDSCISKSFNVMNLLNNLYIDNENTILSHEYEEILKYKLTTFPSVIINNRILDGTIKESKIIKEICLEVREKPEFCTYLIKNESKTRKKALIYFLIALLVLINIFIFFVCRKYILQRINERIEQGGLDLDSRIKNVIGNYLSLNSINNDYVRMGNNPTTSTDLKSQTGKAVDIAVEMT